ncbi:penicillin acylase family protein [Candidatus Sumerlaeota bacterium]|nr:penicillin acylase family protein [Candidatus Sumerlaeota bacterium]
MIRPIRLMLVSSMLLLNAWGSAPAQSDAPPQGDGTEIKLSILSAPVEVVYDKFAIPHIYGKTVEDTYRVIGYIHASNRLLEMEMFRRTAAGTLAEAVGPDAVNDDIMMRKLKIRATSEEAYKSGLLGAEVNHWLECYAEGVNAKLAELGKDHLPPLLKFMGIKVAPWTPTDTISFMKYMGWDQSGTDSDLWMGQMVEALGAETVEELWPIERPYEIPTVPNWPPSGWPAPKKTAINFHQPSEDMIALAKAGDKGFGQANYLEYMRRLAAASLDQTGTAFGSNNWVIGG